MRYLQFSGLILAGLCLAALAIMFVGSTIPARTAVAAEAEKAPIKPEPVEDSDHEFMEYAFEPPFNRLKKALAAEPQERAEWKSIRSDSLILAEAANLLLLRESAGDDEWDQPTAQMRAEAAKVYRAAGKPDFAAAREAFRAMTASCNRCHEEYGGEDLEP
ncbi:MAG: cytochrome c [Pirellulaceae bacterium]|nr:cytochrome c [Pirellulaceae bacterium]